MRHIQKKKPPSVYTEWFNSCPVQVSSEDLDGKIVETRKRIGCTYKEMRDQRDVIEAIERSLLEEQGYICSYTGIAITEGNFHIEHLKPQKYCSNTEDVDYRNILAAYPNKDTNPNCPFGANKKDDWYDPELMVSPLHSNCSNRFIYRNNGAVEAANSTDLGAIETIKRLGLDHERLRELRRKAIIGFKAKAKDLSIKKLETISKTYCDLAEGQMLAAYCFVIQPIAKQLLECAKRRAKELQKKNSQSKQKSAKGRN